MQLLPKDPAPESAVKAFKTTLLSFTQRPHAGAAAPMPGAPPLRAAVGDAAAGFFDQHAGPSSKRARNVVPAPDEAGMAPAAVKRMDITKIMRSARALRSRAPEDFKVGSEHEVHLYSHVASYNSAPVSAPASAPASATQRYTQQRVSSFMHCVRIRVVQLYECGGGCNAIMAVELLWPPDSGPAPQLNEPHGLRQRVVVKWMDDHLLSNEQYSHLAVGPGPNVVNFHGVLEYNGVKVGRLQLRRGRSFAPSLSCRRMCGYVQPTRSRG